MNVAKLQTWANQELQGIGETTSLDVDILLAHVLQVSRAHLFAFPEREVTSEETNLFKHLIAKRKKHIPVPYCTGHQEFWSLNFVVTEDTLIPRPETELLVECVLQKIKGNNKFVADLGTGSGAVALAIAYERPSWHVVATDVSQSALKIAKLNAERLHIKNVIFCQGAWCAALPQLGFDAIVSNPPYIAPTDPHLLGTIRHEPRSALVATENGLQDLRCIITEAHSYLNKEGWLLVEHGAEQAYAVRNFFMNNGYKKVKSALDLAQLERVTLGQL